MPKFKNSNATFWVIFKHCALKLLKQQRSLDIFFRNQIMQFLSAAVSRLGHVATVATPHPTGKVFSSPAFRPHDDGDQSHPLTAMYGNVAAAFVQG